MFSVRNSDVAHWLSVSYGARLHGESLSSAVYLCMQSKPCYTMKMMVVGAAGKGKTTLLSLLINDKSAISAHPNHATVGIAIKKWR